MCNSFVYEDMKSFRSARFFISFLDLCFNFLLMMFILCYLVGRALLENVNENQELKSSVFYVSCVNMAPSAPQATGLFLSCSLLGSKRIYSKGKRKRTKVCCKGVGEGNGMTPIGARKQAAYLRLLSGPKATCLLPYLLQPLCTAPTKN